MEQIRKNEQKQEFYITIQALQKDAAQIRINEQSKNSTLLYEHFYEKDASENVLPSPRVFHGVRTENFIKF